MLKLKSIIYKAGINILRMFWRIKGRRNIKAFGEDYYVTVDTIFPNYRNFRLPKKGCLSKIVRYADYVQLHSVVHHATQLKEHPIIIDIGAHHGAYAIILGKIVQKKGGRVIAVEPNPQSFDVLKENVLLNKLGNTVVCEQVAIADKTGCMNIDLVGSESKLTSKQTNHCCAVDVITSDQLLKKYAVSHVDLLIVDVEGAELPVLRGLPWETVAIKKIFCELHPYAWKDFSYSSEDVRGFLNLRGYRCFDMYFKEHVTFNSEAYIGPTLLIPENFSAKMTRNAISE
jgi:FkbM family methyltransferase